MKISYDSEIDALYIRLVEGKHQCRTLQLTEEIALNIGENELLVGIEVLDATQVLGSGNVPNVVLENIALYCCIKNVAHLTPQKELNPKFLGSILALEHSD